MTKPKRPDSKSRPMARAPITNWRSVEVPDRLKKRPRDERGFVIPYSVDDGTLRPDFRITQGNRVRELLQTQACWICGGARTARMCFIGGPKSILNHLFTDGWQHDSCGAYALRVCPFLSRPEGRFSERELPEGASVNDLVSTTRPEEFGMGYAASFTTLIGLDGTLLIKSGGYSKVLWYSTYGTLLRISSGTQAALENAARMAARKGDPRFDSRPRVARWAARRKAAKQAAQPVTREKEEEKEAS